MSAIKDGGPAFPVDHAWYESESGPLEWYCGMSLRDYFAAKAMVGCLANPDIGETMAKTIESGKQTEGMGIIGKVAYAIADGMLAARQQEPQS